MDDLPIEEIGWRLHRDVHGVQRQQCQSQRRESAHAYRKGVPTGGASSPVKIALI